MVHDLTDTPVPAAADPPEALSSRPPAEWWIDRSLAERLYELVERHELSSDAFAGRLAEAVRQFGSGAYAELIFLLTRLRLDPADAERHWPGVLARQEQIASQTGCAADIRVALLSYFLDVDRQFERPKVVEMGWVEWTMASALLDPVTGLPNQRLFRTEFRRELERSAQENSPLSLVVLDADGFKRVNDLLGHDTGTSTLAELGRELRARARSTDLVARYGGDEFVALLPATTKAEAARIAEALRGSAAAIQCRLDGAPVNLPLSFSAGVATCPGDGRDEAALFAAADRAMYDAKKAGKNRVCLYGDSTRSFSRRRAEWTARLEPAGAPGLTVETIEVGEGGFSCRSAGDLPLGGLVEASFTVPGAGTLRVAGRVAWTRAGAGGGREIAVRFIEGGGSDRARLSEWVASS